MNKLLPACVFALVVMNTPNVSAVTVVECVDADGNTSFRDQCPPGSSQKGKKEISGLGGNDGPDLSAVAAANPITLYTVPDCDACDLTRNALSGRDLPFTEKNVQDNAEMQEELKTATGGLTVPGIVIGDKVLTGYSRDAIDSALNGAGYPAPAESGTPQ
jgi:glutaredoxin